MRLCLSWGAANGSKTREVHPFGFLEKAWESYNLDEA